jgi:nucleotide-binding universal stress UspA family protein
MQISTILVPVAFSKSCRGAKRYAAAIARQFKSDISVLHVAEPVFGCIALECGCAVDDIALARRAQIERDLDSFFTHSEDAERAVTTVLLEGDPATQIVRYAHNYGVDLIVMPTHGFGPFRRFLMGSVTAKVLHDVTCPVWTGVHLDEGAVPDDMQFRNVVCAVDLGPQTFAVLNWAAGFASVCGATMSVVHCLPPSEDRSSAQAEMARILDEAQTPGDAHITSGHVPDSICDAAKSLRADLLVIGRGHGCGNTGRLPSHAYAILRSSSSPVISV